MKLGEMKKATVNELIVELKNDTNGFMDGMWDSMNLEDKTVANRIEVAITLIKMKLEEVED